jgi:hypothetical protein
MRYGTKGAAVLLAVSLLASCGDDNGTEPAEPEPGEGTPVTLSGTFAGSGLSGDLDITIAGSVAARAVGPLQFSVRGSAAVVSVSGCVYFGSTTCSTVSGSYNTDTKALNFTTTNPAFTFTGTYEGGRVQGSFSGAGGSGVFTAHRGTVTVFCGTYTGDSDGIWNLVRNGNDLDGVYYDISDDSGSLSGTVSGSNVSITFAGGSATGTVSGGTMSGTWQTVAGSSGTWSGSTAGCR